MTLKENLEIIINQETKKMLDSLVVNKLIKRILTFKDEWNLVVKQQDFHITIGNVDYLDEKSYYVVTIPRITEEGKMGRKKVK